MTSSNDEPSRRPPQWSGVGGGCLLVLVVLGLLIWFVTTVLPGTREVVVPDVGAPAMPSRVQTLVS